MLRDHGPSPEGNDGGSSLVELLLVISLVLVLLAGVLTGVVAHQRQRQLNADRQLAVAACRNTIEQLRAVDILSLPGMHGRGFDVPGTNGAAGGLQPVAGDPDGLPGEISVVPTVVAGANTLYLVSTRVVWRGSGPNSDVRLECLMGQRR